MGIFKQLFTGRTDPVIGAALEAVPVSATPATSAQFSVDIDSGVLYGVPSLDDYVFNRMRVSRVEALAVPAVRRARDLICGEIGQFPLVLLGPDGKSVPWALLSQPEHGVPVSVTMTHTVEDMLLTGHAWWKTTYAAWHGRAAEVVRLDADTVTVQPNYVYHPEGSALVWPDVPGLIRFDSPNAGLLTASPAIRACVALDRATLNYVDGTPPIDYFTGADGVDPDQEDVIAFLDAWQEARRLRATGYVPSAFAYNTPAWDPEKLQLASAREFAITEIARLTGIDAEELSVSTTSRTYANMQDRRRQRIDSVLGPFMTAIEGRLSMDDLTPRGFRVAFDTSSYLRLDDMAAAQADEVLIRARVLTPDEARAKRGLQPLGQSAPPNNALPSPIEESASA